MLLHTVKGNEGQQDGYSGHILLILGIGAVGAVLPQLQSTGAAEHHVDDADIAEDAMFNYGKLLFETGALNVQHLYAVGVQTIHA